MYVHFELKDPNESCRKLASVAEGPYKVTKTDDITFVIKKTDQRVKKIYI